MGKDGSNFKVERLPIDALPIELDGNEPIQRQIYAGIRDLILRRTLSSGSKLPATRELAKTLAVSRNTIVRVYEQLNSEGYVETIQGSKTYVADLPPSAPSENVAELRPDDLTSFVRSLDSDNRMPFAEEHSALRPSTPDTTIFPFKTWNRLLGRNLLNGNTHLFNYNYSYGYPPLQEAIAKYLQAYRGVRCEPAQVVVTNGAQAGMDLLARVLLEPGDVAWMEEPGWVNARQLFSAVGADIKFLEVNEDGWDLQRLPNGSPRVIYVTPSSQHPLAITMRIEQRLRLQEIAYREGAWIIEDDYDSEYRVDGRSIPAMQGSDNFQRTIYLGSFAKTLFPALRVGFIVLPSAIVTPVQRAALWVGSQVSLPVQATLADFIIKGHFAQHLRRTRRLYAQRRIRFLELCDALLGQWLEPLNGDVGIQIAFRFKFSVDDAEVAREANRLRLNVIPLSRYYHGEPVPGLFLGYAALDEKLMEEHLGTLAKVIGKFAEG